MRKWLLLLATTVCLAGCNIIKPPLSLIAEPKINATERFIQKAMAKLLPENYALLSPTKNGANAFYHRGDLDGDGKKEVVTFYEDRSNYRKIEGLIMSSSGIQLSRLEGAGYELHTLLLQDIDHDGADELFVGYSYGSDFPSSLYIYKMKDDVLQSIGKLDYTDLLFLNGVANNTLFVATSAADDSDLLNSLLATTYTIKRGKIAKVDQIKVPFAKDTAHIQFGKYKKDGFALFLNVAMGANSSHTEILPWKHNKFSLLTADSTNATFSYSTKKTIDINDDGILDVAIEKQAAPIDEEAPSDYPLLTSYYNFTETKRHLVAKVYHNYSEFFMVKFDRSWPNDTTVQYNRADKAWHFIADRTTYFTVMKVTKQKWNNGLKEDYSRLGSSVDFVYVTPSKYKKLAKLFSIMEVR